MGALFAKKLYELIGKNRITVSKLAKELNLSRMMIYQYLNEISLPSKERMPAIAKALQCDEQELISAALEDYNQRIARRKMGIKI